VALICHKSVNSQAMTQDPHKLGELQLSIRMERGMWSGRVMSSATPMNQGETGVMAGQAWDITSFLL
jgi:hypothetical protein